jgi:hypothetical protein
MTNVPRIIFDRFRAGGLSPQAAAALVGNIGMESSFNTGARNAGDGRDGSDSIGLAQWNSSRAAALKQFAAQKGTDWRDPATQADFIVQELNTTENRAKQALAAAEDPRSAGEAAIGYFRPAGFTWANPQGGHNADKRIAEAVRYAGEFGNLPAQSGVAATSTPMMMPDLTPSAPAPEAAPSSTDTPIAPAANFDFAKALAALATTAQPQAQPQKVAPKPAMPAIRQQTKPVQITERTSDAPKKANLQAIFGV